MYLEIDEGFFDHPKTMRVCGIMKDPNASVYILRLWRWACRCAPDGSLEGMSATEVEMAAGYAHLDGKLYVALASRFVDEKDGAPYALHDWMKHQGGSIRRMQSRSDAKRAADRDRQKRKRDRDVSNEGSHANVTRDSSVTSRPVTHQDQTSPGKTRPAEEEAPSELSPRPSERSAGTPVPGVEFPCDGPVKAWALTRELLAQWSSAYPSLDLEAECRKALAWVLAKPDRRKTAKGMSAFLLGWFGRTQDRGGARSTGPPVSRSEQRTQANLAILRKFADGGPL